MTEADYAAAAQRHPDVQRAACTRRWTGMFHTMFITVDRRGGKPVTPEFEQELRDFLERFRMAGYDLEIDGPRYVALDLALNVCVMPGYLRAHVKQALLDAFGTRELPDGTRGFFHPGQLHVRTACVSESDHRARDAGAGRAKRRRAGRRLQALRRGAARRARRRLRADPPARNRARRQRPEPARKRAHRLRDEGRP